MPRSKEGIQNKTKDQERIQKIKNLKGVRISGTLEIFYLEIIWLFVFFCLYSLDLGILVLSFLEKKRSHPSTQDSSIAILIS